MNQKHNHSEPNEPQGADVQGRRELVRKLGKFAVYVAPFTVLALKGNAEALGGGGSGGYNSPHTTAQAHKR